MSEILADRDAIAHELQQTLDKATDRWGILVERVEVKNVRLPENLQRAMAAEAEATREAAAKVIANNKFEDCPGHSGDLQRIYKIYFNSIFGNRHT